MVERDVQAGELLPIRCGRAKVRYRNEQNQPMPLSWNEIRDRAVAFSKEWKDESSEDAEAKSFWDSFFAVFGITRRRVASFEKPVRKSDGKGGFIDLLWKGMLVVEHKSRGKDLTRAYQQATDYFSGLKERDLPRYVLVSDFARFCLYDLDEGTPPRDFPLEDLHRNVRFFGFIAGYETRFFGEQDPVNIAAAEKLGKLHDQLKAVGYDGHALEVFLVRLLFCLFAEDNSIFEPQQFRDLVELRSNEDGSDLAALLGHLFQVLNTPGEKRLKNLDEQLADFNYINGKLFAESLPLAAFDRSMREALLDCTGLKWARISPAIFGALFQSISDAKARRSLGAHYTSEGNILKALRPLFLDDLRAELARVKHDRKRLLNFHEKLGRIRVFDPACGCGNFLVIAYRELRLLELDVLGEMFKESRAGGERLLDVSRIVFIDVDQFFGIEIEEFPAQIAQVALWMTDHQMNLRVSEAFGQYFVRLPLKKAPSIVHDNALQLDWRTVVEPSELTYIVGNPPFVGKQYQTAAQKSDLALVVSRLPGGGVLDLVAGWYVKAAAYIAGTPVRCALVSTNSVTQGEQVLVLWGWLLQQGIQICFAHRTFQWRNEARGMAAVHCVIIGFQARGECPAKTIFEYLDIRGEPHSLPARSINPYLIDAPAEVLLTKRRDPISRDAPPMAFGSMPNDGGHLLLPAEAKDELLTREPGAARFIRRLMGSDEFINGIERYCLWLVEASPVDLRGLPRVRERVAKVQAARLDSKRPTTKRLASRPTLFGEMRQPSEVYLAVPEVSSENRRFIPMGFLAPETIATNKLYTISGATLLHFGILQSTMHMAWTRSVSGRLESRYQYSAGIVYNNFPWPTSITEKRRIAIEQAGQGVLEARTTVAGASLADLYDPLAMPPALVTAHEALDRAVDVAYSIDGGKRTWLTEAERVAFLFSMYQQITAPLALLATPQPKKAKTKAGVGRTD